ncbi:MAG: hypothetical protein LBJ16_00720 [Holosporaceae bacterium]|nr:hypothetical protein [Holosporaceae bacterium]
MYTAVLRSVCSYKFLEISLFRKKSISIMKLAKFVRRLQLGFYNTSLIFLSYNLTDGRSSKI